MRITVQKTQEVEVNLPKFFKAGFTYHKLLPDGQIMQLWNTAIFISSHLGEATVNSITEITEGEFNAAYERAIQNIREAYLK